METLTNILFATLRMSTPLILAGMAGVLSQQVNLLNIALEGLMLFGAFVAVVVGAQLGSAWLGVVAAMIFAVAVAALFALFVIDLKANLIVAGLAVDILALGLTAYLLVVLFDARGAYAPDNLIGLPTVTIPLLAQIPVLGKVLSGYTPLVYVSWLAVFLTSVFLYRTPIGVHIRAVGEHKQAAETAGIRVRMVQYVALLTGGALCGLAGAQLSVGDLTLFTDNMTNGRGFIALAAVFFGAARPGLTAIACLLFGLFEAVQFRLQASSGLPPQLPQMLPYLIVVVVLTLMSLRRAQWSVTSEQ
ncbi:MAG: ABC transporter permease [Anaerolineae bacterium]